MVLIGAPITTWVIPAKTSVGICVSNLNLKKNLHSIFWKVGTATVFVYVVNTNICTNTCTLWGSCLIKPSDSEHALKKSYSFSHLTFASHRTRHGNTGTERSTITTTTQSVRTHSGWVPSCTLPGLHIRIYKYTHIYRNIAIAQEKELVPLNSI